MFFADWDIATINYPDASTLRVQGLRRQADIFLALMNTGMALQRIVAADQFRQFAGLNSYEIRNLAGPGPVAAMSGWRHPDPQFTKEHKVHDPALQIRGSWLKLPLRKFVPVGGRQGFSHFVWKGEFGRLLVQFWFVQLAAYARKTLRSRWKSSRYGTLDARLLLRDAFPASGWMD